MSCGRVPCMVVLFRAAELFEGVGRWRAESQREDTIVNVLGNRGGVFV